MDEVKWLECHQRLLAGDYSQWPQHAWIRTGNPAFKDHYEPTPNFGKPIWDGSTEKIRLLINADFGMGDTIHFWRFIPLVKERVSEVILRCDEDFKTLFVGVQVVGKDDPLPAFDKIIHMMALPHVLGIKPEDISGTPYLTSNPVYPIDPYLKQVFDLSKYTKIGACWQGNPFNPRDGLRSMPDMGNYLASQMLLFNLNKIGSIPSNCIDTKRYMNDWNATAHLVSRMDLVVSVDTAIIHLAGALGVPACLVLSDQEPDWRWGRVLETTKWYDSVRIFRQESDRTELFQRVSDFIKAL